MEHYYSNQPTSESEERILEYKIKDKTIFFLSDNGVFSKNHVDFATNLLINTILNEEIKGALLDVGCGYGAIGITLAKFFTISLTMLDINQRALGLAEKNATKNKIKDVKIIESDGFQNINKKYDIIVTNPPIRAGKEVTYKIYSESQNHLNENGKFYLVINKKHGAPSTIKYLKELFSNVEILDKKAGFNVIKCKK